MYIPISGEDRRKVNSILKKYVKNKEKIILLYTTAGWSLKDWEYKKYSLLIEKLKEKYNAIFSQIGTKDDTPIKNGEVVYL